jgi:hypothetical protein
MKITLSPQRRDDGPLTVFKEEDILTINDEIFDFSQLPDGATLPREAVNCQWLASDIERIDGELNFTLLLPHGSNAPEETRFPEPIIDPPDGVVILPPFNE